MKSNRCGGFSGNGASHGKSGNKVNEMEVIGSASAKNNEDGITISCDTKPMSVYERKAFQIDVPPNKRARNTDGSEFVGSMLYNYNCNYTFEAMSPKSIWEDIKVAAEEEEVKSEYAEERKSEAICLVPGFGSKCIHMSPFWKTRLCKKWELNGWCAYGDRCKFAHGSSALRKKEDVNPCYTFDGKQTPLPAKTPPPICSTARVLPRRLPTTVELPTRRWKGPNKISKIYGDWIDDFN